MAFKGLDYDIHLLSAAGKEHKSEQYLALNPRGTVPTLRDTNQTLGHSVAIIAWLDRLYPTPPLFGRTPQEAGQIWQRTMDAFDHLPPATSAVLSPIFFEGAVRATDELLAAVEHLQAELDHLSDVLDGQPYLSGELPGAADAVAFPHIRLIQRAMETKPQIMQELRLPSLSSVASTLSEWVTRIEQLPHVAHTFPPHWAEET